MLNVRQGEDANVIVTASERQDGEVQEWAFRFVAESRATDEKVAIEIAPSSNASTAVGRYDVLPLPASLFSGKTVGQYSYEIWQVRPGADYPLVIMERGLLQLHASNG